MSVPFVGRRWELGRIHEVTARALRGRAPAVALITGDPGSGKSRLLGEALRGSEVRRTIRLVGFEPMVQVPLAAAAELLRVLARAPRDGAALDRLVFGDVSAAPDPLRIFEAAHRAMASTGPLRVGIDDLQWVDERSVALIHYLLRSASASRQPLVVVAVARPSPVAAAFSASIASDLETERRAHIELGPLPLEDGRALARAIDGHLDDVAAADLWRRAAGSPFWLEALVRGRGADDMAGLIRDRLRHLGPDAGAILATLAVGARPLTGDDVAEIQGWDAARVRVAVRELGATGLAIEASGAIRPTHDLIREATTAGLPSPMQRQLHGRLAEWIGESAGDDLPLLREALTHRVAAGLPAADLALRILSSPRHRLLDADGLRLLASISDALDRGDARRLRIDRSLAELAGLLGEQELALDRWKRVGSLTADPDERHQASLEAARSAYRLRRSGEAHEHLDRARALPSGRPEAPVALGALQAEIELWLDHQTANGARTADRTLAAATSMAEAAGGLVALSPDARRATLAAYEAAIDGALQEDRADDVVQLSEASVRVAEGLDTEAYLSSLMRPAFGLRTLGHAREAATKYREAWVLAGEAVLPSAMAEAGNGLSRALRRLGELEAARLIAAETVALERRVGHPPRRWGNAPSILHHIEVALGDASRIRALHEDALAEPDPHYRLTVHQLVATWQAWLHGPRAAASVRAELAAAKASAAVAGCPRCGSELLVTTAELLARIGDLDDAAEALASWEATPPSGSLANQLLGDRARAALAHARGDDAAAIALLECSVEVLEREGLLEDQILAL
ncbi:MAG TPA: AAA family ATPase, partial [Candidatus Limnocylindrales bacterium]|nr:AAA family ATPase [Candidatus Limnocylindrales bacterium]